VASAKAAAGKLTLGRALQWDALASSPISQTLITNYYTHTHTHIYKDMHSPPLPRSLASVALNRQPDKRVCDQRRNSGCGSGWLLAGAGFLPLLQSRVFMVYVLLCGGVFPVLTLYSPRSIVWGLFFSPHLPHVMLYFSSIPCLPVLSTPLSYMYVVYVWTGWWLISLVLVTSDNKGATTTITIFLLEVLEILFRHTASWIISNTNR